MTLTADEYRTIESYLRFKSADIRKFTLSLLMKQDDGALTECISRLLADKKEDIRLGGLDMIAQLKKDEKRSALADGFTAVLAERAKAGNLPSKEKLLLESLLPEKKEEKQEEKALFSPSDRYLPTEFDENDIELCLKTFEEYFPESSLPDAVRGMKTGGVLKKLGSALRKGTPCATAVTAAIDLLSLSKLIEAHKTDSYEWNGSSCLLGNVVYAHTMTDEKGKLCHTDLWEGWIKERSITNKRLFGAMVLHLAYADRTKFAEASADFIRTVFGEGFEWGRTLAHSAAMSAVLPYLLRSSIPKEDLKHLASALAVWFIRCVPDDKVMLASPVERQYYFSTSLGYAHLLAHRQLSLLYRHLRPKNDEALKSIFPIAVASAERCMEAFRKCPKPTDTEEQTYRYYSRYTDGLRYLQAPADLVIDFGLVGVREYLLAAFRGIITEPQLYEFLLHPDNVRSALATVTGVASKYYEKGKQIASHNTYGYSWRDRTVEEFLGKKEPDESDMDLDMQVDHTTIAIIHTCFNLFCTCCLLPFCKQFEKLACLLVKDKKGSGDKVSLLDDRLLATPSIAIERCRQVAYQMAEIAFQSVKKSFTLLDSFDKKLFDEIKKEEDTVDIYEDEIGSYLMKITNCDLSKKDSLEVTKLFHMIGNLERLSDHAVNVAESAEEMHSKKLNFSATAQRELAVMMTAVYEVMDNAMMAFIHNDVQVAVRVEPLEEVIDDLQDALRSNHIERLRVGECTIEMGFILSDLLTNLERVADHCSNIAGCVIEIANNSLGMHSYAEGLRRGNEVYDKYFEDYSKKYQLGDMPG